MSNVIVIGCGGIGGYLALPLLKFMEYKYIEWKNQFTKDDVIPKIVHKITYIDGDIFEEKNLDRQVCSTQSIGESKAKYLAQLSEVFSNNVEIDFKSSYVTYKNINEMIPNNAIVFLCVDNHNTRKLIDDFRMESQILVINGGNELNDGNVQLTDFSVKSMSEVHPEIDKPKDKNPGEDCIAGAESTPQLSVTNNMVASIMLCYFNKLFNKISKYYCDIEFDAVDIDIHETYFDINSIETASFDRKKEKKKDS